MDVILSKLANNLRIEGVEENAVKDILQKVGEYWEFISGIDWDNVDYFGILKEISVARFLKAKFNDETKISIMRQTLSYKGNGVCIFKPNNFEESSVVGEPICCFAFSQGRWEEHYNEYQESIYYVYDALREGTIEDFVAITVRPSGKALVLDKEHNWWSSSQSNQFIKGLGEGALVIKTKDGKPVKLETNENKQHKTRYNMKKTIRLTESDLHRIVRESVKRCLRETNEQNNSIASKELQDGSVLSVIEGNLVHKRYSTMGQFIVLLNNEPIAAITNYTPPEIKAIGNGNGELLEQLFEDIKSIMGRECGCWWTVDSEDGSRPATFDDCFEY